MISILRANFPLLSEYEGHSACESNHSRLLRYLDILERAYQNLINQSHVEQLFDNGHLETLLQKQIQSNSVNFMSLDQKLLIRNFQFRK